MKTKKLLMLGLFSALMLAFFAQTVFADDNDTDNETEDLENDTAPFQTGLGAQMRLLQLEKSIQKNILWGEYIIDQIEAKNASINTSALNSILNELKALKEEVAAINVSMSNDTNNSAAAQAFVAMKKEARDLSKAFREEVKRLLKAGEIGGLKKKLGERYNDWEEAQNLTIRKKVCEYNADKIGRVLSGAGITDPALVDGVRNCSMNREQIAAALEGANLTKGQQNQLKSSLKEAKVKTQVFSRTVEDKLMNQSRQRDQDQNKTKEHDQKQGNDEDKGNKGGNGKGNSGKD